MTAKVRKNVEKEESLFVDDCEYKLTAVNLNVPQAVRLNVPQKIETRTTK